MKIDDGLELPHSQPVNLKIIDSLCFNNRQKEHSPIFPQANINMSAKLFMSIHIVFKRAVPYDNCHN